MLPRYHAIIGLIISFILFFVFPEISLIEVGIIFLSSFLIDFDHYIYYFLKYKNFSVKEAYKSFREKERKLKKLPLEKRKKYSAGFYCFHGIEPIIIAVILGDLIHEYFYLIAIGMIIHLVSDWIHQVHKKGRLFKFSIIYDYFKHQKLEKI